MMLWDVLLTSALLFCMWSSKAVLCKNSSSTYLRPMMHKHVDHDAQAGGKQLYHHLGGRFEYVFFCSARGRGSPRPGRGGGGRFFIESPRRRDVSWTRGAEGRGGSAANWGILGGRLNIFWGAEMSDSIIIVRHFWKGFWRERVGLW